MRATGQDATSAPSGRSRSECGAVPPEMETCARLSTHSSGLFRAAICIGKAVGIGPRDKRAKAARSEAIGRLNISSQYRKTHAPLYSRPRGHDDPNDEGGDHHRDDESEYRTEVHRRELAARIVALLRRGVSGPTTSPGTSTTLVSHPLGSEGPATRVRGTLGEADPCQRGGWSSNRIRFVTKISQLHR